MASYQSKNLPQLKEAAYNLLALIDNMDLVLLTNEYFLLGRWLNAAKRVIHGTSGIDPIDYKRLLEFNARNQITTWGPHENIEDYANKMWSGLLKDFYKPRWQTFVDSLTDSLTQGKPFNQSAYNEKILSLEMVWYSGNTSYPEHPQADTYTTVLAVHEKYREQSDVLGRKNF